MYELKTNTAVRIAVGPLVDPTDGKTAETALTVTGMVVDILQMDNDGTAVNRTSFSPTASGGNNDMVHVTDDTVGMYDLELTAAQLNFLGNARLVFYDVDGFLVHWIDLQLVSAAYFDWKYGTTLPNVNVTQISGDSTAADNCELMFDGTGYAGGTTKLDVNVSTIANNAITANAIAGDAITSAKIADNAIAAEHIADNAIDFATFAADCKTGTGLKANVESISANAITAASMNADAGAEIADAVWDEALSGHLGAGSTGNALNAAGSAGDPWATALPGAYGAGTAGLLLGTTIPNAIDAIDNYVDTEIGTLTTELAKVPKSDSNVSFNATAIAAIQNGLATPTNITAGTITTVTNLTNAPTNGDFTATMKSSITAAVPTAANNADAVWDEASTGHTDAGKAGAQLWTVLDDVPNTSEFQARTIAAADYTVVSDLGTVQTGDSFAIVNGDHGLVSIQDDIDAIKAKTDSLTFTVAGDVDCNVQTWKGSAAQDMTGDSYARLGAPAGASVSADIAAVKAETAAILDDTPTAIAAVKTVVDLVEDILRNKMEITDANGNLVLYEDDGTTPKYSVNACVTDDATTTIRKRLE
jgi:hypothetical protein